MTEAEKKQKREAEQKRKAEERELERRRKLRLGKQNGKEKLKTRSVGRPTKKTPHAMGSTTHKAAMTGSNRERSATMNVQYALEFTKMI